MKIKGKTADFIKWFVILQPLLDILTSVTARYWTTTLTVGMLARMLFVGFIGIYLFFVYDNRFKKAFRMFFALVCCYGAVSIAVSAYYNGMSAIVENGKMFFKMYYFVFALLFFLAFYFKERVLIKERYLTVVFICYTCSIFVSAVTNTSFVTYEYAEGFCGWFYAGNEVGAIVSVLAMIAFMTAMNSKNIFFKAVVGFLLSFSAVYIGTKVPFLACIGAVAVSAMITCFSALVHKDKNQLKQLVFPLCTLLLLTLLFQFNSPMKRNGSDMLGEHFNSHVSEKLEDEEENEEAEKENNKTNIGSEHSLGRKAFLFANWILSDRLVIIEPAVNAYINSQTALKLFGMGYGFNTDYGSYNQLIEMDFIALIINHGLIGTLIYMLPLIYFAVVCIRRFFKNIKHFFDMLRELGYIYSVIIALGCAFLAGHVLVAPSVSIYLAIIIVNLYAALESREPQAKQKLS